MYLLILLQIGQGTYSSVYRARDLETNKIVALKKVKFANMDPESVRFMAREIILLRKLDHPNVMKLEGIITSRLSGSLYLIFEYMEHDLTGLATLPSNKFTESQVPSYGRKDCEIYLKQKDKTIVYFLIKRLLAVSILLRLQLLTFILSNCFIH